MTQFFLLVFQTLRKCIFEKQFADKDRVFDKLTWKINVEVRHSTYVSLLNGIEETTKVNIKHCIQAPIASEQDSHITVENLLRSNY